MALTLYVDGDRWRAHLKDVLARHPGLVHRIVISGGAKREVRDMLDQNNINERMLFPGMPGLCGVK